MKYWCIRRDNEWHIESYNATVNHVNLLRMYGSGNVKGPYQTEQIAKKHI